MRNPRSPAWAQSILSAAALILSVAGLAPGAAAQEKFTTLYVFGDSYADLTLSDKPASNLLAPPGFGLSLWRVYPIPLAANLGINGSQIVDVAVGGATASPFGATSPFITPPPIQPGNLPAQVDGFFATNPNFAFGPRDLVTINIGGNDIRGILDNSFVKMDAAANAAFGYPNALLNPLNAKAFADQTVVYAKGAIDDLVAAGARTFALGGFSSISGLPELQKSLADLGLPPNVVQFVNDSADAYAKAYFDGLQLALLPHAKSGTRFFMLDLGRLGQQVQANLSGYGLVDFICPGGPPVCGGSITSPDQQKYYFGPDRLHLTEAGFAIVAAYMANNLLAPDTIAVQPGIVASTTGGFTSSLLGRLNGVREAGVVAGYLPPKGDGPMGLGLGEKSPQPGRLTAYTMGTILGGSRSDAPDVVGFEYDSTSGSVGIEYSYSRNFIFGLAGNYAVTSADLTSGANIDVDSIQAAAYVSYATRHVFADALAAYGSHDVNLVRPGVIDAIRSNTDAASLALAARAGYLFDLGLLRAGPIAGLTYIRTRVDGYTEKGDPLLTFSVGSQTLDSLTGNVGVRFLAPFQAGGSVVVPYLNIMLEHQFGDGDRTLTASLTQAPLLPILTPIPNFDTRTYGRIEGGITLQLGPDFSTTLSAASTFARDEAHDFRVSTGLNFRF